jgi:DNA polymerase II small subunit/DNA polymerase delta subunit B
VVNPAMVDATGLESLCHTGNSSDDMVAEINRLCAEEFTDLEIQKRNELLGHAFDNQVGAKAIITLMK